MTYAERIDPLLERAVSRGDLAGVVATVEAAGETRYEGAAGHFELDGSGPAFGLDTPLRIASMTKAVTSVAAMQLVERGQIELDAPVAKWLPQLEAPMVLEEDGTLRPARTAITARQLLTHSSGFGYDTWNARLAAYLEAHPLPAAAVPGAEFLAAPLIFDPGTQWHYSISTDWLGELVVAASGQSLGAYLDEQVFAPLGMGATGFRVPPDDAQLATLHARQADGSLARQAWPAARGGAAYESGGGGLRSTARDYGRFLRMLLGRGALDGVRVLEATTVDEMAQSHTGDLDVGVLTTANAGRSNSGDLAFGRAAGFGLGFLVTLEASRTGRSAGSLTWGGLFNSYYWIDLERDIAGAIYTQVLPFLDVAMMELNREFERGAYEALEG
ncbi:MAG: serine hydrolase [Chloroflexi bacterium]|nr:serine hydrolase [Chloroflexota bacterium]MDA1147499.1 serine hydrolase [Chloroflexota bacterium]